MFKPFPFLMKNRLTLVSEHNGDWLVCFQIHSLPPTIFKKSSTWKTLKTNLLTGITKKILHRGMPKSIIYYYLILQWNLHSPLPHTSFSPLVITWVKPPSFTPTCILFPTIIINFFWSCKITQVNKVLLNWMHCSSKRCFGTLFVQNTQSQPTIYPEWSFLRRKKWMLTQRFQNIQ